jgi:predicted O-methyltransferase YrrM
VEKLQHLNIGGEDWFSFPNLYRRLVADCPTDGRIVEVGSWKGKSTAFLLVEAWNKSPKIEIYAVDTWLGSEEHAGEECIKNGTLYEEFLANVKTVRRQLVPLRMTSLKGANFFPDQSLDSVFIDAAHDYENVKADILAWLPKVKKGGLIGGHDYQCGWVGVDLAVQQTMGEVEALENSWLKQL